MNTCTKCHRTLPLSGFPRAGKQGWGTTCTQCRNDQRRLLSPLPVIGRDPEQIRLNNTFNLWHGPVRRVLLRSHA